MATTTPNYGWPVPTSTDYVKDGATAIEALGDAIDATVFGLGSGLTLIKTQTIGTTVASVNVTSAFSTTYDNYKIVISGGVASAADNLNFKLGASTTGYYSTRWGWRLANTAASFVDSNNGSNFIGGAVTTNYINLNCELVNPFLAKYTLFNANFINETLYASIGGEHRVATSYTDFTITPGSGTLTGGTISVYGYKK
jgi:hypothetical protein